MKKGIQQAPHRSLFYALGYTPEELERPLVGIVSSWNEIVPGHMHEVGKSAFGASYDRTGEVTLADGTHIDSIPTAIKKSIAYVSKDRDNESLVISDTIRDNICLPSLTELAHGGLLFGKNMNGFADKFASLISVKMTGVGQFVSDLSGGNKQKVALARWIGKDSDIIVLDSPTRGIDVKVKADIYALMYLIFGVATTVVSWIVYGVAIHAIISSGGFGPLWKLSAETVNIDVANIISWIISVTFAFITNKLWVFESKSWARDKVWKEA